jgi:phenylpyruvate tautomerase PptA (4-oxalocrotonate tautomerase family)
VPQYTAITQEGSVSDETKAKIAREITRIHTSLMKVPTSYVRVVFLSYPKGSGYTAGEESPTAALVPIVAELPGDKDSRGRIVVDGAMRSTSHPEVWALGDCASIPAPDGRPYTSLAQHVLREARLLARNIAGVLDGRPPKPFVYTTLGMMGSLGHSKAFGQLVKIRLRGFPAWLVRRTYYLLQMPTWHRRLRIVIDWSFALLFRPDVVKISLETEEVEHRCEPAPARPAPGPAHQAAAFNAADSRGHPLTTGRSN